MATAAKGAQTDPTLDRLVYEKQLEAQLISRCWQDANFKKRLLADPRSTIEGALSLKLPSGMKVRVQEEAPDTLTLILPARPLAGGELSDAELEQVAGGRMPLGFVPAPPYTPPPDPPGQIPDA
jgi:hypothetical protein